MIHTTFIGEPSTLDRLEAKFDTNFRLIIFQLVLMAAVGYGVYKLKPQHQLYLGLMIVIIGSVMKISADKSDSHLLSKERWLLSWLLLVVGGLFIVSYLTHHYKGIVKN